MKRKRTKEVILENCRALALVTTAELAAHQTAFAGAIVLRDGDRAKVNAERSERLPA